MATDAKSIANQIATTVQLVSVVIGVVISVLSFNASREKDAEARKAEASRPFLELRQKFYLEILDTVAVLANPEVEGDAEIAAAKKRFRELYVAKLSIVEDRAIESQMVALARLVDSRLVEMTETQTAAYNFSHALAESYFKSWKEYR